MQGLDDSLPIVPDEGLGGIKLRSNFGDYEDIFVQKQPKSRITGPFQVWYTPPGFHFQFAVDVRDGQIFMIKACEGYRGALFDKIHVGMTFGEARKLIPTLHYDDAQGYVPDRKGVAIDLRLGSLLAHRTVEWIAVYAPERFVSQRWKIL